MTILFFKKINKIYLGDFYIPLIYMELVYKNPLPEKFFFCKFCEYKTSNKKDYKKHVNTEKHKTNEKWYIAQCINIPKNPNLSQPDNTFKCLCGNHYKFKSGLYRHKKKCKVEEQLINTETQIINIDEQSNDITVTDAKLVFELLKQNNEFKEMMLSQTNQMMSQIMELAKSNNNITNNINNGQIQNTQNTQFNIQMYLNETCKNAMTIDEFLDYLQPTLEELEATAHLGYVEGITRIIMRGLKDLEEELRPFHCTDLKREALFVKNPDGEWEKETDEKPLMLKFVKAVARKNFNNVNEWRKLHPNCRFHDSKSNDMFNQIMLNSTSGRTEEEQMASYKKIIKNIVKESVIDKSKKNK